MLQGGCHWYPPAEGRTPLRHPLYYPTHDTKVKRHRGCSKNPYEAQHPQKATARPTPNHLHQTHHVPQHKQPPHPHPRTHPPTHAPHTPIPTLQTTKHRLYPITPHQRPFLHLRTRPQTRTRTHSLPETVLNTHPRQKPHLLQQPQQPCPMPIQPIPHPQSPRR